MAERYQEWIRFSFVASGRYLLYAYGLGRILVAGCPDAVPDNTPEMSAQLLVMLLHVAPIIRRIEFEVDDQPNLVVERLRERMARRELSHLSSSLTGRVNNDTFELALFHPGYGGSLVVAYGSVEHGGGGTVVRAQIRPALSRVLLSTVVPSSLMLAILVIALVQGRWSEAAFALPFSGLILVGLSLVYRRWARRAVRLLKAAAEATVAGAPMALRAAARPVLRVLEAEQFFRSADALRAAAGARDGARVVWLCMPERLLSVRVESVSTAEWCDLVGVLRQEALRLARAGLPSQAAA